MEKTIKRDTLYWALDILFKISLILIFLIFLMGQQITSEEGRSGIRFIGQGSLLIQFFLFGILLTGGTLLGLLARKGVTKILAAGMLITFCLSFLTLIHPFPSESLGWGYKACFLLSALSFILALIHLMSEKNHTTEKSWGVSILLTLFFGPLGLFYATKKGAFIMLVVSFILLTIHASISTFALKRIIDTGPSDYLRMLYALNEIIIAMIPIACTVWGMIAVNKYNQALTSEEE